MNVKLQKQLAYNYKGKQHFKHVIVVPDEAINELGWKGGQDLDIIVKSGQLVVKIKKEDSEEGVRSQ